MFEALPSLYIVIIILKTVLNQYVDSLIKNLKDYDYWSLSVGIISTILTLVVVFIISSH